MLTLGLVLVTGGHLWDSAILQSPLHRSRKLANPCESCYCYHLTLKKDESDSVLSYKLSIGAEDVCGLSVEGPSLRSKQERA